MEVHAEIQKRKDKKDGKKDDKQDELFAKWTKEQEALLAQLREDLEATSKRNMLEAQNDAVDFQQNMLYKVISIKC